MSSEPRTFRRKSRRRAAEIAFFVLLGVLALVLTEAGYRLFLHHQLYAKLEAGIKVDPAPTFGFYAYPAPWRFDRNQGFVFNDGPWLSGRVLHGAFDRCEERGRGNRHGNFGEARGSYHHAEFKIALFGSSYTLIDHDMNGDTTSNLLQDMLARRLGKTVHVLNYSRDATGILTMFDIAQARLPIDKPDLAIFTFNTTALGYQRHWRVVAESRPGFYRMYQSLDPTDKLEPHRSILNGHVISRHVNREWCDRMTDALRREDRAALVNDPILRDLIKEYRDIKRTQDIPRIGFSFFTPRTSFVLNQLRYGDPYHGTHVYEPKTIYAPLVLDSYVQDHGFLDAIAAVKATGIPFLLVHLPTLNDFRNPVGIVFGAHGVPPERERTLLKSLEELADREIVRLITYYDPNLIENALALVMSEQDSHPSPRGVPAMAEALNRLLLDGKVLGSKPN